MSFGKGILWCLSPGLRREVRDRDLRERGGGSSLSPGEELGARGLLATTDQLPEPQGGDWRVDQGRQMEDEQQGWSLVLRGDRVGSDTSGGPK